MGFSPTYLHLYIQPKEVPQPVMQQIYEEIKTPINMV
jgi:hypothetical protein